MRSLTSFAFSNDTFDLQNEEIRLSRILEIKKSFAKSNGQVVEIEKSL